jgi:hypothetical protein
MAAAMIVLLAPPARAQADTQVWGDLLLDRIKSQAWTFHLEIEPKGIVSKPADTPAWATIDVTPAAEFAPNRWFSLGGELHAGATKQSDDQNSTEITPRLGLRLHVLSGLAGEFSRERRPKHRVVLSTLIRAEWRNLYYSDDTPQSSTFRVRDRIDTQISLNRPRTTDDGAVYATSDVEFFWTHKDPPERFASKERIRAGLGYRHSLAWRFEALYVWDRSRDSADQGFTTAHNAIDIRVRRVW